MILQFFSFQCLIPKDTQQVEAHQFPSLDPRPSRWWRDLPARSPRHAGPENLAAFWGSLRVPLSDEIHGHPHETWGNPPMYYGNNMGIISFGDEAMKPQDFWGLGWPLFFEDLDGKKWGFLWNIMGIKHGYLGHPISSKPWLIAPKGNWIYTPRICIVVQSSEFKWIFIVFNPAKIGNTYIVYWLYCFVVSTHGSSNLMGIQWGYTPTNNQSYFSG